MQNVTGCDKPCAHFQGMVWLGRLFQSHTRTLLSPSNTNLRSNVESRTGGEARQAARARHCFKLIQGRGKPCPDDANWYNLPLVLLDPSAIYHGTASGFLLCRLFIAALPWTSDSVAEQNLHGKFAVV